MRCFIAAEISKDAKDKISEALKDADSVQFRLVKGEHVHITLKFLGEIGEKEIEICKTAMEKCLDKKILVTLAGGNAFMKPSYARVVFVNVISEELMGVANCLSKNTRGIGDEREFVGHLTVARARSRPSNAAVLIKALEKIHIKEYVERIALKKSTLTPQGPIYEDLYVKALS